MATWEDGPEYAPLQRPEQFSAPEATPLEDAPARPQPSADAPSSAPGGYDQASGAVPLAAIGPDLGAERDPHRAFDTVSSLMTATSSSAWTSAHSSQQWGAAPPPPDPRQPLPIGAQQAAPDEQQAAQQFPAPGAQQQFPAPGTQQWFAPDPAWSPPGHAPQQSTVRQVVAGVTTPVLVCLALGLIPALSPFALVVAFALSRLGTRARWQTAIGYAICLGVVAMVGLTALLSGSTFYSSITLPANLACLVMLIASPLLVQRHLASGAPPERRG